MAYLYRYFILFFLTGIVVFGESMYIQQKQAPIKEIPSFLGKTVVTCKYGDTLQVIAEEKEWVQVQFGTKKGWIHSTSVTKQKIVMNSSVDAPSSVTSNEVMLAGKGFNQQVEGEYRKQNPKARFDLVDKMERRTISPQQVDTFVKNGALKE